MRRIAKLARERTRDLRHEFRNTPPALCNSIQKAGTHLLVGLVDGLPGYDAYGRKAYWHHLSRAPSTRMVDQSPAGVVEAIAECRAGEIVRGHIAHHPGIAESLRAHGVRHALAVRDPRDLVVSLYHWWMRHNEVDVWPYRLFMDLDSTAARLDLLINGWPESPPAGFPRNVAYPHIGERLGEYLPWLEDPNCLVVRFEDVVGDKRDNEIARVARHFAPEAPAASAVEAMRRNADPSRSKTFRQGKPGTWDQLLDEDLVRRIEYLASPAMRALGYEF